MRSVLAREAVMRLVHLNNGPASTPVLMNEYSLIVHILLLFFSSFAIIGCCCREDVCRLACLSLTYSFGPFHWSHYVNDSLVLSRWGTSRQPCTIEWLTTGFWAIKMDLLSGMLERLTAAFCLVRLWQLHVQVIWCFCSSAFLGVGFKINFNPNL